MRDEEDYIFGSLVDDPTKIVSFRNVNFRAANMKEAFKTLGVFDFDMETCNRQIENIESYCKCTCSNVAKLKK